MKGRPQSPSTSPDRITRIDGLSLSADADRKLNEAIAILFRDELGQRVWNYLENITINKAHPPGTPPDVLAGHNGACYLIHGLRERRKAHGKG